MRTKSILLALAVFLFGIIIGGGIILYSRPDEQEYIPQASPTEVPREVEISDAGEIVLSEEEKEYLSKFQESESKSFACLRSVFPWGYQELFEEPNLVSFSPNIDSATLAKTKEDYIECMGGMATYEEFLSLWDRVREIAILHQSANSDFGEQDERLGEDAQRKIGIIKNIEDKSIEIDFIQVLKDYYILERTIHTSDRPVYTADATIRCNYDKSRLINVDYFDLLFDGHCPDLYGDYLVNDDLQTFNLTVADDVIINNHLGVVNIKDNILRRVVMPIDFRELKNIYSKQENHNEESAFLNSIFQYHHFEVHDGIVRKIDITHKRPLYGDLSFGNEYYINEDTMIEIKLGIVTFDRDPFRRSAILSVSFEEFKDLYFEKENSYELFQESIINGEYNFEIDGDVIKKMDITVSSTAYGDFHFDEENTSLLNDIIRRELGL
jgi:hypothetical protein